MTHGSGVTRLTEIYNNLHTHVKSSAFGVATVDCKTLRLREPTHKPVSQSGCTRCARS